jgi:hypothetical protein
VFAGLTLNQVNLDCVGGPEPEALVAEGESESRFAAWLAENKNYKNLTIIKIDSYRDSEKIHTDEYSPLLTQPNALIELVSETSKEVAFITEKTFRPILLEQPFICLGAVNQNLDLVKYGFELYDEIFDYSFDSKPNLEDRIKGIIENLNKIKDEDYYQLYNLLEPKIKRNKERMFSLLENDPFNPYIGLYQKYIN